MTRLLFFLTVFLALCGCRKADAQQHNQETDPFTDYVFHDDFFYEPYFEDGKFYLIPYLNESYIRFETNHQTEVLNELLKRGFQLITEPVCENYIYNDALNIPENVKYGSVVSVKGYGNISDIPHVIYSHHLYHTESGEIFGRSNMFWVYYDIDNADSQIKSIMQYAEKHNIYPVNNHETFGNILIACTNMSSGNPVELSNWFVEVGGFAYAIPVGGYTAEGIDSNH